MVHYLRIQKINGGTLKKITVMRILIFLILSGCFIFCEKSASDPDLNFQGTWSLEKMSISFAGNVYDFAVDKGNVTLTADKISFKTNGVAKEWKYSLTGENRFMDLTDSEGKKISYEIKEYTENRISLKVLSFTFDSNSLKPQELEALTLLNLELLREGKELETMGTSKNIEVVFIINRK